MSGASTSACNPLFAMDDPSSPPSDGYDLQHITRYLDRIEECIQHSSSSPALKYQHCHAGVDNKTFFKVVGNVLAKPMLRTLIYGDVQRGSEGELFRTKSDFERSSKTKKIFFDQRIRDVRAVLERERICSFMFDSLQPAALQLDGKERDEKIPDLLDRIDALEDMVANADDKNLGANGLLSRLASGRRYKGKMGALIDTVFPQLSKQYVVATQKATDREVFEYIIANDLVNEMKVRQVESDGDEEGWSKRRINAAFRCLDRFYPLEAGDSPLSYPENRLDDGIESGRRCEESCLAFVCDEYITSKQNGNMSYKVLQNVYVNARRGPNSKKYIPPKQSKDPIIWTACGNGRHRLCSEFDAVVLCTDAPSGTSIESIWEAKKTCSPSTLYDILSKKIGSIDALMDDEEAELVLYRDENAADSVRSIAGAHVVNSNMQEVILALERDVVMVEVDVNSALQIVRRLKSIIEMIEDDARVEVRLFVEEGDYF
ncbi:hypothetical protein ACHAXT_008717 [Thalassiosira profunda]